MAALSAATRMSAHPDLFRGGAIEDWRNHCLAHEADLIEAAIQAGIWIEPRAGMANDEGLQFDRAEDRARFGLGRITTGGYRQIATLSGNFSEHRLIWELFHGPILDGEDIDHINQNKLDNRIENLRRATRSQNMMNAGARRDNAVGLRGVSPARRSGRTIYRAKLSARHLGYFDTPEEASAAYLAAARAEHGLYVPPFGI